MLSPTFSLPGYSIQEQIYTGSRTIVYKGKCNNDQVPVVIKSQQREYPSFSELLQFRNQYIIAKNLDIPGVVKPYSLETYNNGYALVMEFGGISLKEWVTGRLELGVEDILTVAIQIATILDQLHRNRIIHKDIKPANILINPETKQVKLIDFSISSLLPRETQQLQNPNVLEGTLGYISPEQTGRMNRGIDYRTDFYSLGITLYELITGELPFVNDDPMELVHCHIAKQAVAVYNIKQDIPRAISDIVAKLMAKNAEDRYQSALGLKSDLETCLYQYKETQNIKCFELGTKDISELLLIPEKLYGREKEVETLLDAFERVSAGSKEMMLVAGFSGIGKTAVVNEVHKPIVKQRGYFIKGKYDQFQRNIPFSAFVQAFRDLMGQLLSESDNQIQKVKINILEALGENAQVIIDVIPELEKIIGKQPPALELLGNAAQNRFNLLFHKFIQVFANNEHPLVVFLDDLQWTDSASLKLMQSLMTEDSTNYLLLLGAYRDNEVFAAHPLITTLEGIKKSGLLINQITLSPLAKDDLNSLVADTLSCSQELALPLTNIVYQKTQGNPFFSNQLLKSLYEDKLIKFNVLKSGSQGGWECDIAKIRSLVISNDVVEFMALQLQKLPLSTQEVLKLAACIGNQFDLNTLAIVYEKSPEQTATDLWNALQEGLILPTSEVYKFFQDGNNEYEIALDKELSHSALQTISPGYKFLHDRVQQASYSLIPEEQKKGTHLKIGQLLLKDTSQEKRDANIFDIVNQLNIGFELITEQSKKDELAEFNLFAGKKAKSATAYEAAVKYLSFGLVLLGKDSWLRQYVLTLNLYVEASEAEYLNTNFEQSATLTEVVLQNAETLLDQIKAYEIKIQFYFAQNQMLKALQTGRQVLDMLGISVDTAHNTALPQLPQLEDLEHIPVITDPYELAALRVLMAISGAAMIIEPASLWQIILTMVNLCIERGNSPLAAYSYCIYGILLCGVKQDLDAGYHANQLALKLLDQFQANELKSKVYVGFNGFVKHWKKHCKETLPQLVEGIESGLETGDIEYASYNIIRYCDHLFLMGERLETVEEKQGAYIELMLKYKQEFTVNYQKIWHQLVLNLVDKASDRYCLIGDNFDEAKMLPYLQQTKNGLLLFSAYLAKLILLYSFKNYTQAVENAKLATEYAASTMGMMIFAAHNFYYSLAVLALYPQVEANEQTQFLEIVAANQQNMEQWAHNAPMNYLHKYYLVEAERHRILGEKIQAIECYDLAISLAKEHGYLNEEALANELTAKFYLEWKKEQIAQVYMTNAYYCYARWGARANVDELEKNYPQLLAPVLKYDSNPINKNETISLVNRTNTNTQSSTSITAVLDLAGVIKASQAISSEIETEKLLSKLMQIVLENAGAKKSALLLLKDTRLVIEVIADLSNQKETQTNLESTPLEKSQEVPQSIINYVKNTLETLVIHNVNAQAYWANDSYIQREQPKSILCIPIINQSKFTGVLYLENSLTIEAFTTDRVELLNLLVSQAAISLENARLYNASQQALEDLKQAQLQLIQSEKMSALGNLVAGVAHEINNPVGFIAGNIAPAIAYVKDVFGLLDLYQQEYPSPNSKIQDEIETIDLNYVRSDLPKLLASMKEGTQRIRSISNSLRTFSRADTENKVVFNIHDGINSTILILKHRLKASENRPEIEIIKNYGNLPQVECFPGQLNQVFMNLLANAIDALEESNKGRSFDEINANPNIIEITTNISDNQKQVIISIKDNGFGMSDSVKQRIFDHSFTTKAVGKGTGLGLAIARQIIIEKHGGSIMVYSQLGKGAEFVITLPIY